MHAVFVGLSQLVTLYSQPNLPNGIFYCQVSQIWHFSKVFGSKNYHLALSGEKHLATVFATHRKQGG